MAHHTDPTSGYTYADTAFVTRAQRVPGVSLEHMGFGEFTFTTPKGDVEVDRMHGEDFEGQSGRSHKLYDRERGTRATEWLIEQVEKHHLSDRVASVELEAAWFGKTARAEAAAQYKHRMDGIRKGLRHIDTLLGEHEREQSRDSGNWGFAGDLGYVEEHVTDVLEFLRNGKSGDGGRLASEKTAASSYRGDPGWITARFPGKAEDGTPVKRGDRILYWPRTKTVMVGDKAEAAWRKFQSEVEDEDAYNGRYASSVRTARAGVRVDEDSIVRTTDDPQVYDTWLLTSRARNGKKPQMAARQILRQERATLEKMTASEAVRFVDERVSALTGKYPDWHYHVMPD